MYKVRIGTKGLNPFPENKFGGGIEDRGGQFIPNWCNTRNKILLS